MQTHAYIGYPLSPMAPDDTGYPPSDPGTGSRGSASLAFTREEIMTMQGLTARYHIVGTATYDLGSELLMWGAQDIDTELGEQANFLFRPVYASPEGVIKTIQIEDYPAGWQSVGGVAEDARTTSIYVWTSLATLLMHVGIPDSIRIRLEEALKISLKSSDEIEVQLQRRVNVNPFTLSINPAGFVNVATSTVINPNPFEFAIIPSINSAATSEVIRILNSGAIALSPGGEVMIDIRANTIEPIIFFHGAGIW